MPIKRENKSRYSSDWAAISNRIRFERAGGRCEFPGCVAVHEQLHPLTGATVILTVAHLDHMPENCADGNLFGAASAATTGTVAHTGSRQETLSEEA